MSFAGRFVPREFGGGDPGPFASRMVRLVLAGVASGAIVGIASVGMLFSTAPEWASLLFEPISLLLMPGMMVSIMLSGPHDLDPSVIVQTSIVLYFLAIFGALELRAGLRKRRLRRARVSRPESG